MSDCFDRALDFVLRWEGGYSEDPDDLGGATNHGITQAVFNAYLKTNRQPIRPVREITGTEVRDIYQLYYWKPFCSDQLPPELGIAVFNAAVNMGVQKADLLLLKSHRNLTLFLALQWHCYKYYAQFGQQGKFLTGWKNRLAALCELVGICFEAVEALETTLK